MEINKNSMKKTHRLSLLKSNRLKAISSEEIINNTRITRATIPKP